jgi:NAD(P)-dependent dehydrogenase (short-subunit alcohol dehydrogenase family)
VRILGLEKLRGKTALVTGSTDGVGRLVARKLGQAGARVLVHGRDAERGARVVAGIEASGGAADFLAADLSALAEVRRLADTAQATVDRLDILINNAGIGTAGPRQTSAEGFELRFAVNYLAGLPAFGRIRRHRSRAYAAASSRLRTAAQNRTSPRAEQKARPTRADLARSKSEGSSRSRSIG